MDELHPLGQELLHEEVPAEQQPGGQHRTEQRGEGRLRDERHLHVEVRGTDQAHDPVSRRRLNADTRTVFTISSRATKSISTMITNAAVCRPVQQAEQVLQDLPLVLDRLDARLPAKALCHHVVLGRVVQLDPPGLRHRLRTHRGEQRVVRVVSFQRLYASCELSKVELCTSWVILSSWPLDLGDLLVGGGTRRALGGGLGVRLGAEVDAHLDLVVPVPLHGVDLVADEQRGAGEGER
ncbi:hypothetical protein GCM10020229_76850 [Kitasatospora albolonga]